MNQAKNDLSSHFDTAVVALADLNRNRSATNDQNQNENSINKQIIIATGGGATSLENQKYSGTQTIGDSNMNETPKRGEFIFFNFFYAQNLRENCIKLHWNGC